MCTIRMNKISQDRKDARPTAKYCVYFLDVQKAYKTVCRNGFWKKWLELGIRGRLSRIMKKMRNVREVL